MNEYPSSQTIYPRLRVAALSLLFALSAILAATVLTGCGGSSAVDSSAVAEKTATSPSQKPLTEEYLREQAARRMGQINLVRSVSITPQGADKLLDIKVSRPETCHDGAVVGVTAVFAQKMMAQFFKYPEVARMEISMYGTDQSILNDELVLRVMVDRAAAQKIDWFQFNERTITTLATEFYAHPKMLESYNTEGGDPSGPHSQTLTAANATT